MPGMGSGTVGASSPKDEPKERKADLRCRLFWVLGFVVLYNLMGRLLFSLVHLGVCASRASVFLQTWAFLHGLFANIIVTLRVIPC